MSESHSFQLLTPAKVPGRPSGRPFGQYCEDIFVFGSNLAGRHGKGAALHASKNHGAEQGIGFGLMGSAYALPTKDWFLNPLPLEQIEHHVKLFLYTASQYPSYRFNVTCIGCGLAGFTHEQIAPMFLNPPGNCAFQSPWAKYIDVHRVQ